MLRNPEPYDEKGLPISLRIKNAEQSKKSQLPKSLRKVKKVKKGKGAFKAGVWYGLNKILPKKDKNNDGILDKNELKDVIRIKPKTPKPKKISKMNEKIKKEKIKNKKRFEKLKDLDTRITNFSIMYDESINQYEKRRNKFIKVVEKSLKTLKQKFYTNDIKDEEKMYLRLKKNLEKFIKKGEKNLRNAEGEIPKNLRKKQKKLEIDIIEKIPLPKGMEIKEITPNEIKRRKRKKIDKTNEYLRVKVPCPICNKKISRRNMAAHKKRHKKNENKPIIIDREKEEKRIEKITKEMEQVDTNKEMNKKYKNFLKKYKKIQKEKNIDINKEYKNLLKKYGKKK